MFTSTQLIMDVFGRPIFVLPVDLSKESCRIRVGDKALDFISGNTCIGHVDGIDTAILALVAQQKTVGIIAYPENSSTPCPQHLTHTAAVEVL